MIFYAPAYMKIYMQISQTLRMTEYLMASHIHVINDKLESAQYNSHKVIPSHTKGISLSDASSSYRIVSQWYKSLCSE